MYKIYADGELIYDSTLADYKIGKGGVELETNKSGSFTFSVYPDHFYYDKFVHLKTVIVVKRSGKIIFRGRVLNDVTDYFNNKVITCEGELGFLQDSIIRPFTFTGTPVELFTKFVNEHNAQVDEFKRFKIGTVTVVDPNNKIARSNTGYETTISNLNSRLIEDSLGGYFFITHGSDGTEEIPTLNYLADFTNLANQVVEFGSNLKDYTKTVQTDTIATAVIPLGKANDKGNKLTIKSVNNNVDYLYDPIAVDTYGWIFKIVDHEDVEKASNLLTKGRQDLISIVKKNITIELTAIDLHLLDKNIESFNVGDYIRVLSKPHNFDSTLLCNKMSIDLLRPDNDKLILGYTYSTFTETSNKTNNAVASISTIKTSVTNISNKITEMADTVTKAQEDANTAIGEYDRVVKDMGTVSGDLENVAGVVTENARNIATNAQNIATNASNISDLGTRLDTAEASILDHNTQILDLIERVEKLEKSNGEEVTE